MADHPREFESPAFTAAIDGCIVRGYLDDRRAMIRELKDKGFSREAILDRARHLGLSTQFLRRCSIGEPKLDLRHCLGCGEGFLSVGIQNRLCPRCRHKT